MDLEISPLNFDAKFDSLEVFDSGDITFFKFKNVLFGNSSNPEEVRILKGTYVPIVPTPHYFHFLKESLGSYLHYKKNVNSRCKVLWLDLDWNPTAYHNAQKPIQETLEILTEGSSHLVFMPLSSLEKKESSPVMFEEMVIGYDPGIILTSMFPRFDQFKHHNNDLVRDFFKDMLIKDLSMPSKIYISRREVSKYLHDNKDLENISRYNPKYVEDALEDYFKESGYTIINLSGMSIRDQIKYFYNAEHVAGLLGAGIWNGIFSDNGCKFFVIRTHAWFNHEYDIDINSVIDAEYKLVDIFDRLNYNEVYQEVSSLHKSYNI
jgi:hypothetical protein